MTNNDWPESFLAHVWAEQRLTSQLRTRSGLSVSVRFPGHHNTMAGPDFVHAVLELDGATVRGDVEMHQSPGDWRAHNHHLDPRYNRVILHCVFEGADATLTTIREDGRPVEIVDLGAHLHDDLRLMLRRWKRRSKPLPEPVCPETADWTPARKRAMLRRLGEERLQRKVRRFEAELALADWDELAYQGLFEALGYSNNKLAMCNLAQAIPWRDVTGWRGVDATTLAAVWMGVSGLLEKLPRTVPSPLAARWREAYVRQTLCTRDTPLEWRLFRMRAVNHPAVRLAQAAVALQPVVGGSLHRRLLRLISAPEGKLTPDFVREQLARFFHSDELPEGLRIGAARLDAYAVNILVPQMLLYARNRDYPELESALSDLWRTWPCMAANQPLRRFARLWKVKYASAAEQQGALRMWRLYCFERRCDLCAEEWRDDEEH